MIVSIKRFAMWALSLAFGVIPAIADGNVGLVSGQLYSIKNKDTGTSLFLGAPDADNEIRLTENLGAAILSKTETGWQILSPCAGVVEFSFSDYCLYVKEESDFEVQITPYGEYYKITFESGDNTLYYLGYTNTTVFFDPGNSDQDHALWEINPLPAGAIVDVPAETDMVNRTYKDENGVYVSHNIELSDEMGFACAHEVTAYSLSYTRDLSKAGWQGLCAPIELQKSDWAPFGTLYRLDKLVEETDGSLSLTLAEVEEFVPGKPYLIYVENPGTMEVARTGDCVLSPSVGLQPDVAETAVARCELACVYDFTEVPFSENGDATKSYALSGGSFKRPSSSGVRVNPYRVMLTVTSSGSAPARIAVKTSDGTTVVDAIETEAEPQQWYDLSGRPATRGLLVSPAGKVIKR